MEKRTPPVYHELAGRWRVMLSGNNYAVAQLAGFGSVGYETIPPDYDGDGKTDPAIVSTSDGRYFWFSHAF